MALAMAITTPRQVTSGYYRNNLYVLLGLLVVVGLVAGGTAAGAVLPLWLPVTAAALSYLGAACWLMERAGPGILALIVVAGLSLTGALIATPVHANAEGSARALLGLDPLSGGLLLGFVMAAMLLGHWYLNAPGMQLAPLKRLVGLMGASVLLRALVSGCGLAAEWTSVGLPDTGSMLLVGLRWLAGLVGAGVVVVMTWQTLKIPNTQSATGILYVGVIVVFLGELTAQLLSASTVYPL